MNLFLILKILILMPKANISEHEQELPESGTLWYSENNALHHYKTTTREVPYHALIAYNNLYCSGAIIQSRVVVTAASCFVKWQKHRIVVKVGSDTVTGMGQVIEALEVKKHEYFGQTSLLDNDIAILLLQDHVSFDVQVQKVVMIESDVGLEPDIVFDVSGYGDKQPPKYPNSLLWSEMKLLNMYECMKLYPGLMTRSNICAKYSSERNLRDNGGPAVFKEVLVGILSYGADNEAEPFVAVLTNVSFFHNWIKLNSIRLMMKHCVEPTTTTIDYDQYQSDEE